MPIVDQRTKAWRLSLIVMEILANWVYFIILQLKISLQQKEGRSHEFTCSMYYKCSQQQHHHHHRHTPSNTSSDRRLDHYFHDKNHLPVFRFLVMVAVTIFHLQSRRNQLLSQQCHFLTYATPNPFSYLFLFTPGTTAQTTAHHQQILLVLQYQQHLTPH